MEEGFTALLYISVRFVKITRIPRICNIPAFLSRKIKQFMDFPVRITVADNAVDIADVPCIHSDNIVEPAVFLPVHLTSAVGHAGNSDLPKFPLCTAVRRIADLLTAGRGGINIEPVGKTPLIDHVLKDRLCHC